MTNITTSQVLNYTAVTALVAGVTCVVCFSTVFAQEMASHPVQEVVRAETQSEVAEADRMDCFSRYTFGSVQANLVATTDTAVPGTEIVFSGNIVNINPYPVVDGTLYVKIFKKRTDENDGHGPEVIDQFLVPGEIYISADGATEKSFLWNIPSHARSGEYYAAFFFTTSRKFNLLGLSFTDDVVGNVAPFTVVSGASTGVFFDKTKTTVAGERYTFASMPPRVGASEEVPVTATVKNTTSKPQIAVVTWTVFMWDAQIRENKVHEQTARVTIPGRASQTLTTKVTHAQYPVYYVVGKVQWENTTSFVGIRFVREGIDRTRINFPSIAEYPLRKGVPNTLFACVHNMGMLPSVQNNRLDVELLDTNDRLIHAYSYHGDITNAMMGTESAFIPDKNYGTVVLKARLYTDGRFVDEAHLVYSCESLGVHACAIKDIDAEISVVEQVTHTPQEFFDRAMKVVLFAGIGALFLAFLVWKFLLRRL